MPTHRCPAGQERLQSSPRAANGPPSHLGAIAAGVASLTALLLFVQNVLTILTAPGAGHLSDRLGDRGRVVLLGEAVGVAGLAWFALGDSMLAVVVGIALVAAVYGIIPPLVLAWMGDLGSGLGPLFAYWLLERLGIHWVYGLSALCLALTIPLVLAICRRSPLVRYA